MSCGWASVPPPGHHHDGTLPNGGARDSRTNALRTTADEHHSVAQKPTIHHLRMGATARPGKTYAW
jgi:hypothetical protein